MNVLMGRLFVKVFTGLFFLLIALMLYQIVLVLAAEPGSKQTPLGILRMELTEDKVALGERFYVNLIVRNSRESSVTWRVEGLGVSVSSGTVDLENGSGSMTTPTTIQDKNSTKVDVLVMSGGIEETLSLPITLVLPKDPLPEPPQELAKTSDMGVMFFHLEQNQLIGPAIGLMGIAIFLFFGSFVTIMRDNVAPWLPASYRRKE